MMKFKNLRNKITEAKESTAKLVLPPMLLILKRRGMRIFPDGRRVALFVNDKYNLVFTVPYGELAFGTSPKDGQAVISGMGQ